MAGKERENENRREAVRILEKKKSFKYGGGVGLLLPSIDRN